MSKNSDLINSFKAFEYEKYSKISSREKLIVYTINFLKDKGIPTTFIYICISAFKLFPDKFYFSEEFKEYPHIEMLNRTILHLRPKENNYATGSVSTEYLLTLIGEEVAKQVENDLKTGNNNAVIKKETMDKKKKAVYNDYKRVLESKEFADYKKYNVLNENAVWTFFNITPYTQSESTKKFTREVRKYALEMGEKEVVIFLDRMMEIIV